MRQSLGLSAALMLALGATGAFAADKPIVGLITKTNTNPFFVKMKAGAEEAAKASDIELRSFAGKVDGDNEGQVAAIENLIAAGAKGILITPNDFARHRPDHREGAQGRHPGDRAGYAARSADCGGCNLRHRQFRRRRTDRPMGRQDAGAPRPPPPRSRCSTSA